MLFRIDTTTGETFVYENSSGTLGTGPDGKPVKMAIAGWIPISESYGVELKNFIELKNKGNLQDLGVPNRPKSK